MACWHDVPEVGRGKFLAKIDLSLGRRASTLMPLEMVRLSLGAAPWLFEGPVRPVHHLSVTVSSQTFCGHNREVQTGVIVIFMWPCIHDKSEENVPSRMAEFLDTVFRYLLNPASQGLRLKIGKAEFEQLASAELACLSREPARLMTCLRPIFVRSLVANDILAAPCTFDSHALRI